MAEGIYGQVPPASRIQMVERTQGVVREGFSGVLLAFPPRSTLKRGESETRSADSFKGPKRGTSRSGSSDAKHESVGEGVSPSSKQAG